MREEATCLRRGQETVIATGDSAKKDGFYGREVLENLEGKFDWKSCEEVDVAGVCGEEMVEVVPVRGIEMRAELRQEIATRCL